VTEEVVRVLFMLTTLLGLLKRGLQRRIHFGVLPRGKQTRQRIRGVGLFLMMSFPLMTRRTSVSRVIQGRSVAF
jgi:hypothetical protein